jgi:curved DNA binding protein
MEVAIHSLRPGCKNNDVTELWTTIAEAYEVNICEGVLSHDIKRYVVDGNDLILSKTTSDQKVDDSEMETGRVWGIDVLVSTGPGKLKEQELRTTVYKRSAEQYSLKLKASREALNEISTRFQNFPFTIRALNSKTGRLGVAECLKHSLVQPYPVLYEKQGEQLVHLKSTVLVTNNGIEKITGVTEDIKVNSEKKCDNDKVKQALERSLKLKKKAKAKKKKKKPAVASSTQ